jgi:hypothetical protein
MTVYVLLLKDRLFKDLPPLSPPWNPLTMGAGAVRTFAVEKKAERAGRQWVRRQYKKPSAFYGWSFEYEIFRTRLG